MKKLALVLMCTLVLLFFIGFNYLVWDRENIFKNIEDNQVSIEVLSRELNNQRNAYRALQEEKDRLEEDILEVEKSLETVALDNEQLAQQLQGKDESINVLKSQVDKAIPVQTIERWVRSLNEGYYSEAYLLMHAHELAPDNAPSMKQFETMYKGKLSSITLNSAGYDEESADISAFAGKNVYNTVLDVVSNGDNNPGLPFTNGLNYYKFVLDFDESRNAWVIVEMIEYEPPETPEAAETLESPENASAKGDGNS